MAIVAGLEVESQGLSLAGAYWRVGSFNWNTNNPGEVEIRLDGYASIAAYQAGKSAIASRTFTVPLPLTDPNSELTQTFNRLRSLSYDAAKEFIFAGETVQDV